MEEEALMESVEDEADTRQAPVLSLARGGMQQVFSAQVLQDLCMSALLLNAWPEHTYSQVLHRGQGRACAGLAMLDQGLVGV